MNGQITNLPEFLAEVDRLRRGMKAACRKAIDAACQPLEAGYRQELARRVSDQPAMRRDRTTGAYTPREMRLRETPRHRVWNFPDGTGFAGIVGPKSREAPHAHLVESGTVARMRFYGRHPKGIGGKYAYVEVVIRATGLNIRGLKASDPAPINARRTGVMPSYHPMEITSLLNMPAAKERFKVVYAEQLSNRGIVA